MKLYLPIKTVSEANKREHWAKTARRRREQRQVARHIIVREMSDKTVRDDIDYIIILTRIAPRFLDKGDNLAMSMKAIRDGIADAFDIDDRDPRVEWQYDQRKGEPKEYAVEVEIQ